MIWPNSQPRFELLFIVISAVILQLMRGLSALFLLLRFAFAETSLQHTPNSIVKYENTSLLFFGDSLNLLSASSLPVTLGDIYTLTLTGVDSGASLALTATLTDTTTSGSITVSGTDSANVLGGSQFGYFNHVRVEDGGTVSLDADFDNFAVAVPEPATTGILSALACAAFAICRHKASRPNVA